MVDTPIDSSSDELEPETNPLMDQPTVEKPPVKETANSELDLLLEVEARLAKDEVRHAARLKKLREKIEDLK